VAGEVTPTPNTEVLTPSRGSLNAFDDHQTATAQSASFSTLSLQLGQRQPASTSIRAVRPKARATRWINARVRRSLSARPRRTVMVCVLMIGLGKR
jgi:hypothetical protein